MKKSQIYKIKKFIKSMKNTHYNNFEKNRGKAKNDSLIKKN